MTEPSLAEREEWRAIAGYEGDYEVSNLGRVRRLNYRNRNVFRLYDEPKILIPRITRYCRLTLSRNNKIENCLIHRIVLETFIGPCPSGFEGAHLNGDQIDNRLANLAWVSHAENERHKKIHGTALVGEKNHNFGKTWKRITPKLRTPRNYE